MEKYYDVVFYGQIQDGKDLGQVKQLLAKIVGKNESELEHLSSGNKVLLKKCSSYDHAKKYADLFEKVGAKINIEKVGIDKPIKLGQVSPNKQTLRDFITQFLKKPQVYIILTTVIFISGAVWWKHSNDAKNKELFIAQQEQKLQIEEQRKQLEEQRKKFEEKVERERNKKEFDRSIESLANVYSRWKDEVKLADSTARIALSGPVGNLQRIKREAESLLVPECLVEPKKKMVNGMEKIIDGFISFMSMRDTDIGKLSALIAFKDGNKFFSEYENESMACSSGSP